VCPYPLRSVNVISRRDSNHLLFLKAAGRISSGGSSEVNSRRGGFETRPLFFFFFWSMKFVGNFSQEKLVLCPRNSAPLDPELQHPSALTEATGRVHRSKALLNVTRRSAVEILVVLTSIHSRAGDESDDDSHAEYAAHPSHYRVLSIPGLLYQ
jgi:hypothetical protein